MTFICKFKVGRILKKRQNAETSSTEYLVRWKGFSSDWDTWEPADHLSNCLQKVEKFERAQLKRNLAITQKYAQKLVNRSKMTQQNTDKKTVKVTANKKHKKVSKSPASNAKGGNVSLEDIFKEVVQGASIEVLSPSKKHKSLIGKRTSGWSPDSLSAKKPRKSTDLADHKSKTVTTNRSGEKAQTAGKSPAVKSKNITGNKAKNSIAKDILKKKSKNQDGEITKKKRGSPSKKSRQLSDGKKVKASEKSWEVVDNEISFSSDEEISSNTSQAAIKPLSAKKDIELSVKSKPSKSPSPGKKKHMLKLSVAQLIGKKTDKTGKSNLKFGGSFKDSAKHKTISGNKKSEKVKEVKLKSKKKKLDVSDDSSLTEMDSDSDSGILYSLAESSTFEISEATANQDKVTKGQGRSKSEGGLGKGKKGSQVEKGGKKSKSVSSTGEKPPKASGEKAIRLLDSLKQTPAIIPGKFISLQIVT